MVSACAFGRPNASLWLELSMGHKLQHMSSWISWTLCSFEVSVEMCNQVYQCQSRLLFLPRNFRQAIQIWFFFVCSFKNWNSHISTWNCYYQCMLTHQRPFSVSQRAEQHRSNSYSWFYFFCQSLSFLWPPKQRRLMELGPVELIVQRSTLPPLSYMKGY